jgi:hypothetical protein
MSAHIELSGTIRVAAPPAAAFKFFTPEGERLWVPDWEPEYLYPADGAIAEGLTFRTCHGGDVTLWLVSRCDAAGGAIDYLRVTPDSRMGTVAVRLSDSGGSSTDATISYALTSLSADGDRKLEAFAAGFPAMLGEWERRIAALPATALT